jgi:hypothetical protein
MLWIELLNTFWAVSRKESLRENHSRYSSHVCLVCSLMNLTVPVRSPKVLDQSTHRYLCRERIWPFLITWALLHRGHTNDLISDFSTPEASGTIWLPIFDRSSVKSSLGNDRSICANSEILSLLLLLIMCYVISCSIYSLKLLSIHSENRANEKGFTLILKDPITCRKSSKFGICI